MDLLFEVASTLIEWLGFREAIHSGHIQDKYHEEIIRILNNIQELLQIKEELKLKDDEYGAVLIQDYVNDRTAGEAVILDSYLRSEAFWEDFKRYHWRNE